MLTLMMTLSGCLGTGSGEDSEGGGLIPTAQGSTITVVDGNYLPMVNAHQIGPISENITSTAQVSGRWLD